MENATKSLKEFISGSFTFGNFYFREYGSTKFRTSDFLKMFDHYLKTGENLLDAYSEASGLYWQDRNEGKFYPYSQEKYDYMLNALEKFRLWEFFPDQIGVIQEAVYYNHEMTKKKGNIKI